MIHRRRSDHQVMPWANGKGQTLELWREEDAGTLRFRLSVAQVVEDGPFSVLPGIDRVLTVIRGPGFRLEGAGQVWRCDPLQPVAFSGDLALRAVGVAAPTEDLNVMTARSLPAPEVLVRQEGLALPPPGGRVAVVDMATLGLWLGAEDVWLAGPSVVVRLAF